jgi:CcmD family protein
LSTFAQDDVEMATGLRSEGKIYVVVLVMLVIFLGLAFFLFLLDRRISKLEKKNK